MKAGLARRTGFGVAGFSLVLLASSTGALAADPPNAPGFAFGSPAGEIALGVTSLLSQAAYFLPQHKGKWGPYASVPRDAKISLASDITGAFGGTILVGAFGYSMEAAYLSASGAREPFGRALRATLVDFEAATLSTGLAQLLKRSVGRCRPWAYRNGVCGTSDEDHAAFPSGHTAPVAALAGARLVLSLRSNDPSGYRWSTFGLAEGASMVTAFLRVGAGAHSWEDVMTGWLLGHVTGALVALAHPMESAPAQASGGAGDAGRAPLWMSWAGPF